MGEDWHPRDYCYFCGSTESIETHHIYPRRFGGGDAADNLVDLCEDCHVKVERLYGQSFWEKFPSDPSRSTSGIDCENRERVKIEIEAGEDPDEMPAPMECIRCERLGPFQSIPDPVTGTTAYYCSRCEADEGQTANIFDQSPIYIYTTAGDNDDPPGTGTSLGGDSQ